MSNNRSSLRIMHVLLSRGFAGSERSTAESSNQQCIEHQVCVVIRKDHRRHGVSIRDHLDDRVKVIEVSAKILTRWQLKKAIDHFKPDVIHAHLRRSTRLVAKINPAAATVSTLHIEVNGPHFLKMDGLICNARWQIEKIPTAYQGQAFKANNSLQHHPTLPDSKLTELRASLGYRPEDILIGAVGRYHESKAWDILIPAFKQLQTSLPVKLGFFGSGHQEQKLKDLAQNDDRITFHSYRTDIKDIYQCFDLLVCPSRYEPLPRVMLEAMDAGVPVIASDIGGCKELIDDYGGDLFRVDDTEDLARVLLSRLQARPDRHYPDLSAHYVANANQAIVGFYRQLIAGKKG
ncbi:glycosyltransferase [Gynuella sp.]|uniref:glycosyltransferase n=1 Tax=Gynuella sp. TaxID=2969146 RepID=UPI003D10952C